MDLWTDGTTHVQLKSDPPALRIFRDGALNIASETGANHLSSMGVDVDGDRIFHTKPGFMTLWPPKLRVFGLSAGAHIEDVEIELQRVIALGDGRVLGFLAREGAAHQLVEGVPGEEWAQVTDLVFEGGREVVGLCKNRPKKHIIASREADMSATPHGVVVFDGNSGVVAVRRPGADGFERPYFFNAAQETDLYAEATPTGILVVGRWTGRDSRIWHLHGDEIDILVRDGHGAHAHWAGDDLALIYSDGKLIAMKVSTGDELGRTKALGVGVRTTACAGQTMVLGYTTGVAEASWTGDAFEQRFLAAVKRFNVSGHFTEEPDKSVLDEIQSNLCNSTSGLRKDGAFTFELHSITEAGLDLARQAFAEHGATDIQVEPCDAG